MAHPNQPLDGSNGSYDICIPCAEKYGSIHDMMGAMGMWSGDCDICGAHTYLANALHDFDMRDNEVEAARKKKRG